MTVERPKLDRRPLPGSRRILRAGILAALLLVQGGCAEEPDIGSLDILTLATPASTASTTPLESPAAPTAEAPTAAAASVFTQGFTVADLPIEWREQQLVRSDLLENCLIPNLLQRYPEAEPVVFSAYTNDETDQVLNQIVLLSPRAEELFLGLQELAAECRSVENAVSRVGYDVAKGPEVGDAFVWLTESLQMRDIINFDEFSDEVNHYSILIMRVGDSVLVIRGDTEETVADMAFAAVGHATGAPVPDSYGV
jgi:hypothetical protein